jgi:hypothetical protein
LYSSIIVLIELAVFFWPGYELMSNTQEIPLPFSLVARLCLPLVLFAYNPLEEGLKGLRKIMAVGDEIKTHKAPRASRKDLL